MANFELDGLLSMDASGFVDPAQEAADASSQLGEQAGDTGGMLESMDAKAVAAGTALAGLGAAAQTVLDDTQQLRESLGRTAAGLETSTEETEALATEMSNATFPVDDVAGTLDQLAQAGVSGEESLQQTAEAADAVADATGNTATQIAENAVPALRATGGEAEDLTEQMDTFTFIARETTLTVDDFSRMVTKTGPEIQDLGLGVEETAAIMASLEERGLDSRTAMREFRQAANDAEGSQDALFESLELSSDELETQQAALADAAGSTEDYSTAANESLSAADELRSVIDDLSLKFGSTLEPISAIIPAVTAAGAALAGLGSVGVTASGVVGALGTALTVLTGPIGITAVSIAALVALFADDLIPIAEDVAEFVTDDVIPAFADLAGDVLEGTVMPAVEDAEATRSARHLRQPSGRSRRSSMLLSGRLSRFGIATATQSAGSSASTCATSKPALRTALPSSRT